MIIDRETLERLGRLLDAHDEDGYPAIYINTDADHWVQIWIPDLHVTTPYRDSLDFALGDAERAIKEAKDNQSERNEDAN